MAAVEVLGEELDPGIGELYPLDMGAPGDDLGEAVGRVGIGPHQRPGLVHRR